MKEQDQELLPNQKKIIKINIESAEGLKTKIDSTEIAPFYSYRFYTFEETNSHLGAGPNPVFNDPRPYNVTFDNALMDYLETQQLEVYFVDDNKPIVGIGRGGQSNKA